jgi:plasmid stabilization system protein ParE
VKVRLSWHPSAVDEFVAAAEWYRNQLPSLEAEFLTACRAALSLIQEHPKAFRVVHGEVRRVLLRRFPYALFYRYWEPELLVIAVMHEQRDPRTWQERR